MMYARKQYEKEHNYVIYYYKKFKEHETIDVVVAIFPTANQRHWLRAEQLLMQRSKAARLYAQIGVCWPVPVEEASPSLEGLCGRQHFKAERLGVAQGPVFQRRQRGPLRICRGQQAHRVKARLGARSWFAHDECNCCLDPSTSGANGVSLSAASTKNFTRKYSLESV